ncbi:MAG: glycosyltransferase family 4 protein [Terracidiphilus sp.]
MNKLDCMSPDAPQKRYLFVIKNVAFVYSHFAPMVQAIQSGGWEVWIVADCNCGVERLVRAGMHVIHVPAPSGFWNFFGEFRALLQRYRAMRRVRPDIAHFVTLKIALPCGFAARIARVPGVLFAITGMGTLFTVNGPIYRALRPIVLYALRIVTRHPNAVLATENEDDMRFLIEHGVVAAERTCVIPGAGVGRESVPAKASEYTAPVILCAARMIQQKGIRTLIEAAQILHRRKISFEVWLAGDVDSEYPMSLPVGELRHAESELPLRWLGHRSDVTALLQQCSVFCLPTYYREGLPRVLVEACASARPIVTTSVPGCRDIVQHGVNGILVPPCDAIALANSLEYLLLDREVCRRMGGAARQIFEERFSIEHVLAALNKCFQALDEPLTVRPETIASSAVEEMV